MIGWCGRWPPVARIRIGRDAREAQGSGLLNRDARKASVGSNPTLSAPRGPVSERLKEHDWKSCGGNTLVGSNPTLSAEEGSRG